MTPLYKFCWVLWIAGSAIVVASWSDLVTPTVGWVGWSVALAGTLISLVARQSPRQQTVIVPLETAEETRPEV